MLGGASGEFIEAGSSAIAGGRLEACGVVLAAVAAVGSRMRVVDDGTAGLMAQLMERIVGELKSGGWLAGPLGLVERLYILPGPTMMGIVMATFWACCTKLGRISALCKLEGKRARLWVSSSATYLPC